MNDPDALRMATATQARTNALNLAVGLSQQREDAPCSDDDILERAKKYEEYILGDDLKDIGGRVVKADVCSN